jgi:ferrous iron transport protein A
MMTETLAHLKKGEKAIILSISDAELENKLLEMGCLPGEEIELERISPFGDPLMYFVSGYRLALRKSESNSILIKRI